MALTSGVWVTDASLPRIGGQHIDRGHLSDVDATRVTHWLLDARQPETALQTFSAIRQHPAPHVYLKPTLMITGDMTLPQEWLAAADFRLAPEDFHSELPGDMLTAIDKIVAYINSLPDAESVVDRNAAFKVLRLIASRGTRIQATASASQLSGFVYPLILPLLGGDDATALQTLEFLESQRLLQGSFQSKVHLCRHCGSAFLNFLEVCPECQSPDLTVDEHFHHFKCGYVGPSADFRKDGSLKCPKCELQLHHVGVDYDKPSILYGCNECQFEFQDPEIRSDCFNCGRNAEPERQIHQVIKRYSVTALGESAALYGLDKLFTSILESNVRLFSFDIFKAMVAMEAARIQRYKRFHSTLLAVDLTDLDELYMRFGSRAKEIYDEVSRLFKGVLRESDAITSFNESAFLLLLTETDVEGANIVVQRLSAEMQEVLGANLGHIPEMRTLIAPVEPGCDPKAILEDLLRDDAG